MSILAEKVRTFRTRLADTLLPQDCLLCASGAGGELLCPACLADLPQLPETRCPRCALPSTRSETCGRCQRHPPHFDTMIAAFPYSFPLDRMIQKLKYGHQLALARWFGEQLVAACPNLTGDLIIPMPLHDRRLAERGFNQALEICRPLARHHGITIDHAACMRFRETLPQEGLSLRERRRNLKNAFACSADLSGRHVVLVDDVVTTGASVDECARTLRLHGAAHITVVAIARTLLE
jgi:ComF family protein